MKKMATEKNIIIKHYNGTDYDILYPQTTEENIITVDGSTLSERLNNKVDKVEGKGLSTEDYTTEEKNKLASLYNIEVGTTQPTNAIIWFEVI